MVEEETEFEDADIIMDAEYALSEVANTLYLARDIACKVNDVAGLLSIAAGFFELSQVLSGSHREKLEFGFATNKKEDEDESIESVS